MNKKHFLLILFIFAFAVSVSAQDMIVLINGNMLEAKIEEISPTEIRYRRFDNLEGPLVIINKSDVFSVKYENGTTEVINSPTPPVQQALKPTGPILDPDKLYFGISLEPLGFLAGGPSASGEFSKGNFNSVFHVSFPTLTLNTISNGFGMGLGAGANYFWNSRIGGFYLGGMLEWNVYPYFDTYMNNFIFAANAGYKFITKSGLYFRTGVSAGAALSTHLPADFYYKPDIATGYIFNDLQSSDIFSPSATTIQSSMLPVRFTDTDIVMPVEWLASNDSKSTVKINTNREIINGQSRDVLTIEVKYKKRGHSDVSVMTDDAILVQKMREGSGIRFKVLGDGRNWRFDFVTKNETGRAVRVSYVETKKGKVVDVDIPFSQWGNPVYKNNIRVLRFEQNSSEGRRTSTIKIFDIEVY